jgi:cytidylate kinase
VRNFVITIARGFGSGGKEIATKLAQKLGIQCYERQILKMASEYSGLREDLFFESDEKLREPSFLKRLHGIYDLNSMPLPESQDFTSDDSLFAIQAKIIRDLANNESCVIVGKCANKILEQWANVISVYIEAPLDYCAHSIMNKMQITDEEARKLIKKTDKYRADYYKYYSGGDFWTNPLSYDMSLNSERVGRDGCARIIEDYIKIKFEEKFAGKGEIQK